MYRLYTFRSTHMALLTENKLIGAGISVKIIPVPRAVSDSCGLSARIDETDYQKVSRILLEYEIEYDGIYAMDDKGNVKNLK